MTITLVGSSRELKNRRLLPPIDLLDLLGECNGPGVAGSMGETRSPPDNSVLPRQVALEKKTNRSRDQRKATPTESPRSLDTGNSYAEEMYPFMALLQGRRHSRIEDPDPSRTLQPTGEAAASASGPPETTVSDAGVVAERPTSAAPGESARAACGDQADTLPPTPHPYAATTGNPADVSAPTARLDEINAPKHTVDDDSRQDLGVEPSEADGDFLHGATPHAARPPARPRPAQPPHYARPTSASGALVNRRRRTRGPQLGLPTSSPPGDAADSLLRLCPALEARVMDLRRDNTAAASFLHKVQLAAWQKARTKPGVLVSRNRAVCALEGAELSLLRRQEAAARAHLRRKANQERKRRIEVRRLAEAEAVRVKHEGPSLAEVQAQEQAFQLEKRQRFFMTAVIMINSAVVWRNKWKERMWRLAKFAEALTDARTDDMSPNIYEVSVQRVQRFVRRRQGHSLSGLWTGGGGVVPVKGGGQNLIRRLKQWIPIAHARWKGRRREGGVVIYDFLKDARLTQNIKAIYRFRRKVIRCQIYVKGVSVITRDRLVLLGLFFARCEARLRGRLGERIRQQVLGEAAADLEVHRQLMRPSTPAAATAVDKLTSKASDSSACAGTAAPHRGGGGRWKSQQRCRKGRRGSGGGGHDDVDGHVSELMDAVAVLRLKSALEELETRSAHPDVKRHLLYGLLVEIRTAHQARIKLPKKGDDGRTGRDGNDGNPGAGIRRGFRPDAPFTVDDARDLLKHSPQISAAPARSLFNGEQIGGGVKGWHQEYPSGSGRRAALEGELTGTLPPSTVAGVGPLGSVAAPVTNERSNFDNRDGSSRSPVLGVRTRRMSPMLVLKGVPEAVMSQLVLTAWEKSSPSLGGADRKANGDG